MKFITKLGVTCATITMMASSISYAGTVPVGALLDNYIGSDAYNTSTQDVFGGSNYDVEWMTVDNSVNGELTVKVKSAFISHNTSSTYDLGDLFLMDAANYTTADICSDGSGNVGCNENSFQTTTHTKKSTNDWEYAFDLGGNRDTDGVNESGDLRDIANTGNVAFSDDVITTEKYYGDGHRAWQVIMSTNTPTSVGSGEWSSDVGNDILTMTFDISNAPSLMNATQLALRWQMTCANDIIEVVTNFATSPPAPVPEPTTLLLMSIAGFGLFASRQKKGMNFKV